MLHFIHVHATGWKIISAHRTTLQKFEFFHSLATLVLLQNSNTCRAVLLHTSFYVQFCQNHEGWYMNLGFVLLSLVQRIYNWTPIEYAPISQQRSSITISYVDKRWLIQIKLNTAEMKSEIPNQSLSRGNCRRSQIRHLSTSYMYLLIVILFPKIFRNYFQDRNPTFWTNINCFAESNLYFMAMIEKTM